MSTLSLNPSFTAQLHALAGTALDFVRAVKAPAGKAVATRSPARTMVSADVDTTDVWALYRMNRGADAVAPGVARRLADIADGR